MHALYNIYFIVNVSSLLHVSWSCVTKALRHNGPRYCYKLHRNTASIIKIFAFISVTSANMKTLFDEAQAWIDSAHPQDGNHELNVNKFIDIVRESIARVGKLMQNNKRNTFLTASFCIVCFCFFMFS